MKNEIKLTLLAGLLAAHPVFANMQSVDYDVENDLHAGQLPTTRMANGPGLLYTLNLPSKDWFVPGKTDPTDGADYMLFALPANTVADPKNPAQFHVKASWGECTFSLFHPLSGKEEQSHALDIDGLGFKKVLSNDGGKSVSFVSVADFSAWAGALKSLDCQADHVLTVDDLKSVGVGFTASISSPAGDSLLAQELSKPSSSPAAAPSDAVGESHCYPETSFGKDAEGHYTYNSGNDGATPTEIRALDLSVGLILRDATQTSRDNYEVCLTGAVVSGYFVARKAVDVQVPARDGSRDPSEAAGSAK